MKRALRIEKIFIAQYLKKAMEYKIDFWLGFIGMGISQIINIVFLKILFSQIPQLNGWTFNQLIFIYGFSLIPKGFDHLFTDSLWGVGDQLINSGDFDKYLTRPLNPLYHVIAENFQVNAFGDLVVGLLLFFSTFGVLGIHWDLLKVILLFITIPFATAIYTSVKIITASLAFWVKKSGNVTYIFYMINDFAKYPTSIYNQIIRWIISFIVPFAFTAFYPANYFLTGNNPVFNIGGVIISSIILLTIALFVWEKGVKAYESAGS